MVALRNVCARHRLHVAFSDAEIEFDFVLMTSAYSQYLRDICKQYLALVGSLSNIWVYMVKGDNNQPGICLHGSHCTLSIAKS